MSLSLKICRFDPEVDREPYFQEFRVEIAGHQTVLDVLLEAWRQDPGLSFRRSCRSAICGSFAVTINGTPRLACQNLIREIAGNNGRITIQPLAYFRQLKDLVVDLEPLFDSLKAVVPWLITRWITMDAWTGVSGGWKVCFLYSLRCCDAAFIIQGHKAGSVC